MISNLRTLKQNYLKHVLNLTLRRRLLLKMCILYTPPPPFSFINSDDLFNCFAGLSSFYERNAQGFDVQELLG